MEVLFSDDIKSASPKNHSSSFGKIYFSKQPHLKPKRLRKIIHKIYNTENQN